MTMCRGRFLALVKTRAPLARCCSRPNNYGDLRIYGTDLHPYRTHTRRLRPRQHREGPRPGCQGPTRSLPSRRQTSRSGRHSRSTRLNQGGVRRTQRTPGAGKSRASTARVLAGHQEAHAQRNRPTPLIEATSRTPHSPCSPRPSRHDTHLCVPYVTPGGGEGPSPSRRRRRSRASGPWPRAVIGPDQARSGLLPRVLVQIGEG